MNLISNHPHAIYLARKLAERGGDLCYGEISGEFLRFVERDNAETRSVLEYVGLLLFFYKNRDEEGDCRMDVDRDGDRIFGGEGLVAAFRVYCMLEHFTRKGWIRSEVSGFSVLSTLDRPKTRIDLTLTDEGLKAGNSILWRHLLRQGGKN
ncbi:MAG: hypothetical protein HY720_29175 [Planctomycetes bacterium]|nr:hypothetical protein [Planctomycetota bacterium]